MIAFFLSPCHLGLHKLPFRPVYYRRMAVSDVILRDLALVVFHLLIEKIDRELLLKKSVALVPLVRQNAFDRGIAPPRFLPRRRYSLLGKIRRYPGYRLAAHEEPIDKPDELCLLGVDLRFAVLAPAVAEEGAEGHIHLAVGEALTLSPRYVVRYGSALLLGET